MACKFEYLEAFLIFFFFFSIWSNLKVCQGFWDFSQYFSYFAIFKTLDYFRLSDKVKGKQYHFLDKDIKKSNTWKYIWKNISNWNTYLESNRWYKEFLWIEILNRRLLNSSFLFFSKFIFCHLVMAGNDDDHDEVPREKFLTQNTKINKLFRKLRSYGVASVTFWL